MDDRRESLPQKRDAEETPVIPEDWSTRDVPELARRAAAFVALIGAVELLLFILFSGLLGYVAAQPVDEFIERIRSMPNGDRVDVGVAAQVRDSAWLMIITLAILMAAPGLAFVLLGRGIRRARRTSIHMTQLILLTQIMVLGVVVLFGVIQAIMQSNPVGLTVTVVLMGTPLAVMIYAMRLMMTLRAALR